MAEFQGKKDASDKGPSIQTKDASSSVSGEEDVAQTPDPLMIQFDRRKLYPGLYETEEEVAAALEEYAVDVPPAIPARKRPRLRSIPTLEEEKKNESTSTSAAAAEPAAGSTSAAVMVTRQQSQTDIWGRIPPKEPKELVTCSICDRQVNTLRFASHLDKCMGIGTMTRTAAAAAGNTSTRGAVK
jgi:hypothetical protein